MSQQTEQHECEWRLETRRLGRRVLVYDSIGSTNDRCAEFSSNSDNDGLVVLARRQTAGKGQHGRRWLCGAGEGVLMSVLLFPPRELCRPAVLTAWAAVSVCELIEKRTGVEPVIKWPNDVLIQGRKVCGILIEQNQGVIAGVGLNLNQGNERFETDQLPDAVSLGQLTGESYDVETIAKQLIIGMDRCYQQLARDAGSSLESAWRRRLRLLGKDVIVEESNGTQVGELIDVSFDAVVLQGVTGDPVALAPETIRRLQLSVHA